MRSIQTLLLSFIMLRMFLEEPFFATQHDHPLDSTTMPDFEEERPEFGK